MPAHLIWTNNELFICINETKQSTWDYILGQTQTKVQYVDLNKDFNQQQSK